MLVSAFTSASGASREVLRRVLKREVKAVISIALFNEYEAVLARDETQTRCPLTLSEQTELFDAFLNCTTMVELYFAWRPNLIDEADNHVMELAVAGSPCTLITHNLKDFRYSELKFPAVVIASPAQWLGQKPSQKLNQSQS